MAYQPVQLPNTNPLGAALETFAGLRRLKQAKEYQDQQLALQRQAQEQQRAAADRQFELNRKAQERQDKRLDLETQWKQNAEDRAQREEFDKAVAEHERLTRAGLPLAGQRHLLSRGIRMRPDGTPIDPFAPPAQQPTGAAPAAPPQQPPQGGSPVPDQIEFPQAQSTGPVPQDVYDQTVTYAGSPPTETHALDEWYRPGGPPPIVDPSAPAAPQPQMSVLDAIRSGNLDNLPQSEAPEPVAAPTPEPTNPLIRANLAQQAQNAQRAQMFRMTGPQGQDLGVYDPNEYPQAFQQKAQEFAQQFQGVPEVQQYVPIVTGLIAGGHVEPSKAGELMLGLMQKDKALEQALHLKETYGTTFDQKMELAREGSRGRMAAAAAANQSKGESANDRIMQLGERAFTNWEKTVGWPKLLANTNTVRALEANLAPGSVPLSHKDAQIQLARFFRGAQPTEGEMHLLYGQLGGAADKFDQWVEKVRSGDLSPEQMRQLRRAAKTVMKEHEAAIDRALNSARVTFASDPSLSAVASMLNARVRGAFAAHGVEAPDIFSPEELSGSIVLGSGVAPWQRNKNPLQKARDGENAQNARRADKAATGGKSSLADKVLEGD